MARCAPCESLDVVSLRAARLFGPRSAPQRLLGVLATKIGEICGLDREPRAEREDAYPPRQGRVEQAIVPVSGLVQIAIGIGIDQCALLSD